MISPCGQGEQKIKENVAAFLWNKHVWSVYLLLHWGAIDDVVAVDVAAGLPPMMAVDLTRWRGVGTGRAFSYFFLILLLFWFLMAVCFVPFIKIGFTPRECECVFQCVCVCKLEQLPRLLLKDSINKYTHTQAARLAEQRGGRCKWMLFPFILCLLLYFFKKKYLKFSIFFSFSPAIDQLPALVSASLISSIIFLFQRNSIVYFPRFQGNTADDAWMTNDRRKKNVSVPCLLLELLTNVAIWASFVDGIMFIPG